MSIHEFIDALQRRDVVRADMAERLRAKASSDHRITPEAILKYLIKKGVLTEPQASELHDSLLSLIRDDGDDVLNLAPLPEDDVEQPPARRPKPVASPKLEPESTLVAPLAPATPARRSTSGDDLFGSLASAAAPDALASLPGGASTTGVYRLSGGGKKSKKKRTASGRNPWDSPLILVGGGGLALLLVAGAILYFLMFRETADAVFADAENLFKQGAYTQAIERYRDFAARFSSHESASRARVQAAMSRVWLAAENAGDPAAALEAAVAAIGDIENEPAFTSGGANDDGVSEAKRDLSALLVRIGQGLVSQAEASDDPATVQERVKQIGMTLDLMSNDKYVPESLRNAAELSAMQNALAVIAARQRREGDLADALAAMDKALADGDTAAVYAARAALLASYPVLANNASLADKVREAAAAEQARVKFIKDDRPAETSWPARPVVAELALADRGAAGGAAPEGDPLVVRVDGALYGLASGNGALLWRRHAGLGETAPPLVLGDGVVAADLRGGELWRLAAATGKLVWRLPLGEKVAGMAAAGDRLFAAGVSGKLYVVDAAGGRLAGYFEFSQPVRTAPAVDDRGRHIYVVAEHSIVYCLAVDDHSCRGVYHLGHAAGAVAAPPTVALNKVMIAENLGDGSCRVHLLAVDPSGAIAGESANDRLQGRVTTPLARSGRRLAAATSLGQAAVFEISGAEDATALSVVARRDGQGTEHLARHALMQGGNLWVAGQNLMKLAVLPTENQLVVGSLQRDYHGDAFDGPLTAAGDLVIHVRRPAGQAGVVVAATNAATGREAWTTAIAVPLAGAPAAADPLHLSAITAFGAGYQLDRDAMVRGVSDRALRAAVGTIERTPLAECVDLGGGRLVAGAVGSARLVLLRPNNQRQPMRAVDLPSPLACAPIAWRGGVLAATEVGQTFLLDGDAGDVVGAPFQPELIPGRKYQWLPPAAIGEGESAQFVVSDGKESLHVVEPRGGAAPHLVAIKTADVGPVPLASPLAVVGSTVFAGTEDGRLAAFALPELALVEPVELGGRVQWGPHAVGEGLLIAIEGGELLMIGRDGAIRWRNEILHGALVSRPLADGATALVLHASGRLSRINLADGVETGYADVGQPAVAGPVPLGERVVVAASDGALLVVNRP